LCVQEHENCDNPICVLKEKEIVPLGISTEEILEFYPIEVYPPSLEVNIREDGQEKVPVTIDTVVRYVGPTSSQCEDEHYDRDVEQRDKEFDYKYFDEEVPIIGLSILMEERYTKKDRRVLSLVCKQWYATARYSKNKIKKNFKFYFPQIKEYPFVRYLWQRGFRFNRRVVNYMIHCFLLSTNSSGNLVGWLADRWDQRYDCTGAVLVMYIMMIENYDVTKYALKFMGKLTRVFRWLPDKVLRKIVTRLIWSPKLEELTYTMRLKYKSPKCEGHVYRGITDLIKHSPLGVSETW